METQTSKWKFNTLKKTGYGHLNKGGLIYQVQNKHLRHFRVFVTLNGWLWRQNTRLFCSKEAGSWGTACSASRRRWIPRWSARRLYRWCYWSGPGSLPTSGWHRWRCCTSSSQGGGCRMRGREEPRKHKDKRPFFYCFVFLKSFSTVMTEQLLPVHPPDPHDPPLWSFLHNAQEWVSD